VNRIVVLAITLLAGCTTSLARQAEKITTTRNGEDVAQCKILGTVEAHPPYVWPGDDLKQLKNKAAPLGADTVFVTGRFSTVVGVAYDCSKVSKPR